MTMLQKTITIPEPLEDWVKSQIKTGRYNSDSEYFRELIKGDQKNRLAEYELRSLIKEGLRSGVSTKSAEDVRSEVRARLKTDAELPTQ